MIELSPYASPRPSPRPSNTQRAQDPGRISADYFPLIQKLADMRQQQSRGVLVAFGGLSRRQGVTFVLESLACQLAQHTREQILLSASSALAGMAHATFWDPQAIQRLGRSRLRVEFRMPGWEDLQTARSKFGFVLVDCPPLSESTAILHLSKVVDGVALVIASGEMRREEVAAGCRVLQSSGANLVGLILNKRADPVPRLFSRWL